MIIGDCHAGVRTGVAMTGGTQVNNWSMAAKYAGDVCQVLTCLALLVKPLREWLFGFGAIREGQRCLLRSEIVRLYYRHHEEKTLREYEYRNLCQCYRAYKALGGNSFVDHISEEMREWEII